MFPLKDTTPCRTRPVVNTALMLLNVGVFLLLQPGRSPELQQFFYLYGLVPARYGLPEISRHFGPLQQAVPFFSFMFLHGGWMHLIGNMWMLYIFGDNIEDHLGPLRYAAFYLLCGLASGISHLVLNLDTNVPVVGASGAIAGVMGAYFVLYPAARILTFIPILFIPYFIEIPAFVFLGLWFLMQFANVSFGAGVAGGVAWWAHIGGFIFGVVLLKTLAALPDLTLEKRLHRAAEKKHSGRLHSVRPVGTGPGADLYGQISITPLEALTGTRKLVNVPAAGRTRLVRVSIPPGIAEGTQLRLRGLGQRLPDGTTGNLLLRVSIHNQGPPWPG